MSDAAIQQKLAAMFAANKDEVSVPKIYIDMTGGWETGAILDEIMFWTLPKKNTGRTSLRVFRDQKLWLAVRRAEWWDRKRLTERQADTAIGKLLTQGLVEKDVFLFDGKPTVHLRLITQKFAALYAEKLQEFAAQEDDENLVRDIADLYTMMGFPPQNVISNLRNGEMLNLQNGKIINSPIQPENTTTANKKTDEEQGSYNTAYRRGEQETPDKVAAILSMMDFPGAKQAAKLDELLNFLGVAFNRNVETKEWREFAKYILNERVTKNWHPQKFVDWVKAQKGYPEFWSVKRMKEYYPQAFEQNVKPSTLPEIESWKKELNLG